ncbi:CRISPR-associated endonuclease Cas3'' [Kitasatospora phosalacinea]|uniref:CRISPR-associated endonuclease Cas3'' n=1 Tax=Kitasatospora phosalacinea TaxID=2065 RepID=UPI0005272B46|nr:CRISPR-associated endonuclease Cas3'' [Kitasatospora phosalacinea]
MVQGFEEFFRTATGHRPYGYQRALAADGLPERVRVPSGGGKTAGVVLAWLYRRAVASPGAGARRLVYVLPQGGLADWTHARIGGWLDRPGLAGRVDLHLLAGPDGQNGTWRRHPERTAVLVGTHDVLLSRALMRGFADARAMAPVSFGLLNNDAHWVFDEAPLLGPGLATGERLQALRDALGTTAPTGSTWMSAVGDGAAPPPDAAPAGRRTVRRLRPDPARYVPELVAALGAAHRPGTRTIAALDSPGRAREVHAALRAAHPRQPVVLLHPYLRSAERQALVRELPEDGFLVATRALDAGSDLSGRTVFTELAPWSAVVQRAGRCDRYGEHPEGGELLWCVPPEGVGAGPEAARWLAAHEGVAVTAADLFLAPVEQPAPAAPALGGAELAALFDTGRGAAQVDAAPWVCAEERRTVFVAWRDWGGQGRPAEDEPEPGRAEQCEAPLAEVSALLTAAGPDGGGGGGSAGGAGGGAWLRDGDDGRWRRAGTADLRPGAVLTLDAAGGGHLPGLGWRPDSRVPVPPLFAGRTPPGTGCAAWVGLDQHLRETEEEARALTAVLPGLSGAQREAVALAARLHDLGKCHEVFQAKLRDNGGDPPAGLLAKSKAPWNNGVSARPHFRHELVSALLLLDGEHWHAPGADPSLVTYLVAAHHGQVRVSVRPGPGEDADTLLGVRAGDRTPPVAVSTGERFPSRPLDPAVPFRPGGAWAGLVAALLADPGLGPFRLAHLESLVRTADWRSSARHDGPL